MSPLGEWIVLLAGICMFYGDGVMERVATNRGLSCPECVGLVATLDHRQLGEQIWLRVDGTIHGPFLVVDCPKAQHKAALERRRLVAEVDGVTADFLGMKGPVPCERVVQRSPARAGPVRSTWIAPHLMRVEKYGG